MIRDLDALYKEYHNICDDRGVFPKGRRELHHNDEADWLTYVIALIGGYPSQAERQAKLGEESPSAPGRSPV